MIVSIIIPNYNGAHLLKKNLPKVFLAIEYFEKQTGHKVEVIISDDASSDESETIITELGFPIQFLKHTKNAGFSTNVNLGVTKAKGDILVLLNTDVRPERDFLVPLVAHFSEPAVFAVGCLDKSIEGKREVMRGRGVGKWEKGFLLHAAGKLDQPTTFWASGGSSAFRTGMWKKLGGLTSLYNPFYWEDIDLSFRAWKAGYRVLFEAKSVVVHEHEEGSIRNQFSKRKVTATAYRNQFFFVWLNITERRLLVSHLLWLPKHLIDGIKRGDRDFFTGFLKACIRLPEVITIRRRNTAMSKLTDSDVLKEANGL